MTVRVIKKRLKVKKKYKKSHENCLFGDKVVFLRAFWCYKRSRKRLFVLFTRVDLFCCHIKSRYVYKPCERNKFSIKI